MDQTKFPSLLTDLRSSSKAPISQSTSLPSQWKANYTSLIEQHTDQLNNFIRPHVNKLDDTISQNVINCYKIGSTLGRGQFGKVYKGVDFHTGKVVAIKKMSKKPMTSKLYSMNQIMRQIQIWKVLGMYDDLNSEEVVMLMNLFRIRWEVFVLSWLNYKRKYQKCDYVLELVECLDSVNSMNIWIVNEWSNLGELLWKREDRNVVITQWEKICGIGCNVSTFAEKVLKDIASGLKFLESVGCIHRDIKPSNILVDGNRKMLKISDFGSSLIVPEFLPFKIDESPSVVTNCFRNELNKIVGTPAFIAPEICQCVAESDSDTCAIDGFKADMWSLGVTIYCILYNELPFYGENEFDTYHKITNSALKDKLNGGQLNDLVIGRLLEKNPVERIGIMELSIILGLTMEPFQREMPKVPLKSEKAKPFRTILKKIMSIAGTKRKSKAKIAKQEVVSTTNINTLTAGSFSSASSSSESSLEQPVQITEFLDSLGSQADVNDNTSYIDSTAKAHPHVKLTSSRNIVNFKTYIQDREGN
ncbi:hypothetical protein KAFR_0I01570 [Kazachstania africana CBS 2517]|uniref:Protein kinase domain-containing protein n=1 Tax=Kazachstania africana (strain ATCC 22294 / BCRC 22015 / CBS 2517 / CECT 1963 / NBRC 1671 / NRRL Y-8276) TaxID=1071382 RepID=H2AZY8_KAZAF|nr:hypothetical protein KAFR_0I01570 [Kazachstania africana CBS 2517]CCF59938.1 hypothetical protein KAFR_0I01570 [Kazachstania africana CBS 2517]